MTPPEIEDYTKAREVCACFNLRKASRAMTQIYDNALRPFGLRSGQFMLLLSVHLLEASTMKELADVLGLDRTALTRTVKPLVDRKLLRVQQGKDRRTRFVSLSPAGRGKLVESFPAWEAAQTAAEELLGTDELEMLLGSLQAAFANITEADLQQAVATSLTEEEAKPEAASTAPRPAEVSEPVAAPLEETVGLNGSSPAAELEVEAYPEPASMAAVEPSREAKVEVSVEAEVEVNVAADDSAAVQEEAIATSESAKPALEVPRVSLPKKRETKVEPDSQLGFGF